MSVFTDELNAMIEEECGSLHHGFRPIARQGFLQNWAAEREAAEKTQAELAALSDATVDHAKADLEIAVSKVEALRSQLLRAQEEAGRASNALTQAKSNIDRERRQLQRGLVPPHQLMAARRILDRLSSRLSAWREEPPPMLNRPFKLKAIPDPRWPTAAEQQATIAGAVQVVTEAGQLLVAIERGTTPPPVEGMDEWIEDVCDEVKRSLSLHVKEGEADLYDQEEHERIQWILGQLAIGNIPIPT